jgi:hypothetical protein
MSAKDFIYWKVVAFLKKIKSMGGGVEKKYLIQKMENKKNMFKRKQKLIKEELCC